jgi:hypothetical protein
VRVLLDECLPRRLKRELVGHDARTTPEMGGPSERNGDLLRLAEREFDVLLPVDRKLQYQQDLSASNIAVIVMLAPSNTLADLQPLMARVVENLPNAKATHTCPSRQALPWRLRSPRAAQRTIATPPDLLPSGIVLR